MVLYGVQRVFLQELDPDTMLPPVDEEGNVTGATYMLKCAESFTAEPQIEEGEQTNRKCPSTNAILASYTQDDAIYGYDVTLTENEINWLVFALINGFDTNIDSDSSALISLAMPMMADGLTFKPFRMIIFSAGYAGDDIESFAVFVFNKCKGTLSTIEVAQDFWQPEYVIRAREATKADRPILSIGFYNSSTPPDSLDDVNIDVLPSSVPTALSKMTGTSEVIVTPKSASTKVESTVKRDK